MERFTLKNKLSGPMRVEFPPDFPFDSFPESGVVAIPASLDERIGTEATLILFDKTPFIYEIAKLRPFNLQLKTGLAATRNGPVMFLLFYAPKPSHPSEPFFMMDNHLNPFDRQMMSPWRDLARQTHWHVFLLDAQCEQVGLFEFENVFGLGEAFDGILNACRSERPGDFTLAKAEFSATYSLEELYEMA